ncbi:hypothetical protein AX761_22050 [Rhizobium sp. 58]|nr:hypothetical protein AX761_22050 [Rhizobium sp. 58]
MALQEKFIVVPFRKGRGSTVVPGEMRQASTEAGAERMAELIAQHYLGASAIAVLVDDESGDMTSPRLIREFGQAIDLIADMAA